MTGTVDASTPPASSSGADTRGGAGTWVPAAGTPAGSDACGGSVWGHRRRPGSPCLTSVRRPTYRRACRWAWACRWWWACSSQWACRRRQTPSRPPCCQGRRSRPGPHSRQPRRRSESWRESRRRSARERSRRRAWPPHPSVSRLRLRHRSQRPSPAGRSRLSSPGHPAPARQARGPWPPDATHRYRLTSAPDPGPRP